MKKIVNKAVIAVAKIAPALLAAVLFLASCDIWEFKK